MKLRNPTNITCIPWTKNTIIVPDHLFPCLRQVTTAVREITPAEYDAAMRAYPAACPLLAVAGDRRSGAALLASLAADRWVMPCPAQLAGWADRLDKVIAV